MKEQAEVQDLQAQVEALEAKLKEHERLRDELISTTSHDLRSPIGAINIFCEILISGPHPLEDTQKQNVRMIAEAAEKLQRIVEDTVEIARLHSGKIPRVTEVNISDCIGEAIEQMRPLATQRSVKVERDAAGTGFIVKGEHQRVMDVLVRIISDAVKCCPANGVVHIGEAALRNSFVLKVEGPRDANCSRTHSDGNVYFPKGRLGLRKPGDSRFTWATCERLVELLGGSLTEHFDNGFHVEMALPAAGARSATFGLE